jgi:hypothetical protein
MAEGQGFKKRNKINDKSPYPTSSCRLTRESAQCPTGIKSEKDENLLTSF